MTAPGRRRWRRYVVGLIVVIGGGAAVWWALRPAPPQMQAGATTHVVASGAIEDTLVVTGLVKPAVTIELRAEASGLVESVAVKEGDRVSVGQELMRLDARIAETAVQEAEANLRQAEMSQAAAEMDIDEDTLVLRKKNLERTRELLDKGLVPRSEFETRELEVRVAERSLERARRNLETNRARIEQLKAAAERARAQLQHTIVRSPIDAFVMRRHVEVGSGVAGVSQSTSGGTIVFTLGDARAASLQAKVTATDARRLRDGMDARLKLDSEPDRTRPGRVLSVATAGEQDAQTRLTTFAVVIDVDVADSASWINVPAQAELIIGRRDNALVVPDGCVRTDPAGKATVMVREAGNTRPVAVELGAVQAERVEVRTGVTAGQELACR